jgi:hypothetical protein
VFAAQVFEPFADVEFVFAILLFVHSLDTSKTASRVDGVGKSRPSYLFNTARGVKRFEFLPDVFRRTLEPASRDSVLGQVSMREAGRARMRSKPLAVESFRNPARS